VGKLGAPLYVRDTRIPKGILGIGAVLAAAFPLGGLTIIAFAIIDFFLPRRFKEAGWQQPTIHEV
jgi:hypothetical protein